MHDREDSYPFIPKFQLYDPNTSYKGQKFTCESELILRENLLRSALE